RVLDLDQIAAAAEWGRVMAVGGSRSSPYATLFVWLLFLYDYDAHRRCGAADQFSQRFNDSKRTEPSPSACSRSYSYGGDTTATALTGRETRSASKGCHSSRCLCKN